MKITQHLQHRKMDLRKYPTTVVVDEVKNIASFVFYRYDGAFIGFQRYNPNKDKISKNSGKYFTVAAQGSFAYWGVEQSLKKGEILYIVEGVFKAVRLHNKGLNAIAVLCNNPKGLRNQILLWGKMYLFTVAFCDGDAPGRKLAKYTDRKILMRESEYLDEITEERLDHYLEIFQKPQNNNNTIDKK
ncbi:hypothetical protein MNB_SUP05-SYMBIONT-5-1337 [hydrothermal vent metagenome]|uniref:DNA primase n=1 Tax=hydrothermal vent metagenome TaxID=652676 RepID=A0A1W1E1Z5_9ZZZZ